MGLGLGATAAALFKGGRDPPDELALQLSAFPETVVEGGCGFLLLLLLSIFTATETGSGRLWTMVLLLLRPAAFCGDSSVSLYFSMSFL